MKITFWYSESRNVFIVARLKAVCFFFFKNTLSFFFSQFRMSQRSKNPIRSYCWTLPLLNVLFGIGLCLLHCHDEVTAMKIKKGNDTTVFVPFNNNSNANSWDRLTSGPRHWSVMDKVLFVALIMLALEVLSFICGHSGGKLYWLFISRIQVLTQK